MTSKTPRHARGLLRPFILLAFLLASQVSTAFAQVTRIEQNDPSIVYSGNWYSNSSEQHSGGVAALTNARGARATIIFNGTGITWIGVIDGWAGLATVYLDGTMKVIDSYGDRMQYQAPLFVVRGLGAAYALDRGDPRARRQHRRIVGVD